MRTRFKGLVKRLLLRSSRKDQIVGSFRDSGLLRLASSSTGNNARMILVQSQELGDMEENDAVSDQPLEDNSLDSFHSCKTSISSSDHLPIHGHPAAVEDSTASFNLRIYAVTWNMNGKIPHDSLPKLLENGRGDYDLYVIGIQESPVSSLRRVLHPILGKQYSFVAKSVMGSLQLYVFGKCWLQHHISAKKVDKVRFKGFGGVVGRQKGAVAASFCIGNSSFLFIASHFAAHEKKVNERHVQYSRTRQKIFSRPSTSQEQPGSNFMDESDVVVWLGDLNYRIEGSRGLVKSFVKQNLEKLLWKRDQLFNAVDKGEVFNGFVEGPLEFKPTYKYDVGTDDYDTSGKERVPSWTDRILLKIRDESSISLDVVNYQSIDSLRSSDHRPVKALLRVTNLS
ncbi:hypothetical protein SELMODRAFT_172264 [Selaginella moellendorffii]|uniref:Inositol polyphosphate-related phosphatase domain-containing protein n=1 Tax=Selaginella moellendorffii TaxID=88036 RepID=D8RKQ0_SELML|nr:type IV inositol polyphosphate 5-phosphatase 11 [Selaginella moellendorffii]EFJ27277.1 hypothetical protein SELMODRAFT_172264 [Selaginella moellendorffii]|eukprot:XP_002971528.1 type IV inositol polyphosphate 5-phosphatase 11 [Selaginella moellendorffii]